MIIMKNILNSKFKGMGKRKMKRKIIKFIPVFLVAVVLCLTTIFTTSCGSVEEKIKLATPTNIAYDVDSHKVTWDFVDNASTYVVTFDGGNEQTVRTNNVSFTSPNEEFTFTIQAKSDGIYTSSDVASMSFVRLDSDIELSVSETGTLTWNEVNGATGYEVLVDGKTTVKVATTEYDELETGSAHNIKVRPVRENQEGIYYYSSWCENKSVNKLNQVDAASIKYDNGLIKWNSVSNATSYKVIIGDKEYTTTKSSLEYQAGNENFDITIQAIGDHNKTFDGVVSTKNFIYLDVVEGVTIEDGKLTWQEVEHADAYKIRLQSNSNTPITVTTNSYDKLIAGTQYSISIMPVSTAADTAYFSNWSTETPVQILEAPEIKWTADIDVADEIERTVINWDIVNLATGYTYLIENPDGTTTEQTLPAGTNYIQAAFKMVGTYKIRVKSNANDEAGKFDSAYSSSITVVKLPAPTINSNNIKSNPYYLSEGFTVSFEAVPGAVSYKLYKDEVENKSSNSPQFKVTDIVENNNLREVIVNFYVQSIGRKTNDVIYLSSSLAEFSGSSAFAITVLQTPTNPTVEGNGFGADYKYDAVTHQYGYSVLIAGTTYNSEGTKYSLDVIGENEIKVCSKGNGSDVLASTYSTPITVIRLGSPMDISIDTGASDGLLKFSDENSGKALSYQAVFDSKEDNALPVDTTTNIKEHITTSGTILYMYAIGNYFDNVQKNIFYMTSKPSQNKTFIKLEAPSQIKFDNTSMSWNSPTNVNNSGSFNIKYKIFDNADNTVYNGEFSTLSFPISDDEMFKAGTYTFGIQALGDGQRYINSDVAVSKSITKLRTPDFTVNVKDSRYEWDSVASASSYILTIDGENVSQNYHTSGNTYTYAPTYDSLGEHLVSLYAQGDGGNTTINSSTFKYNQIVSQLQTPTFEYSYSHDNYVVDGKIKINITKESPYCTGYNYQIGGTRHSGKETTFEMNPNTAGKIELKVYAIGGGFDENEIYYSDSQSSAICYLNLLTYPSVDTITINKDGVINWSRIPDALGYSYKLSIITTDNEEYDVEGNITKNTPTLDLSGGVTVNNDGNEIKIKYNQIKRLSISLSSTGSLKKDIPTTATNSYVSSEIKTKAWESDLH